MFGVRVLGLREWGGGWGGGGVGVEGVRGGGLASLDIEGPQEMLNVGYDWRAVEREVSKAEHQVFLMCP